ncbi:ABC transporter ATP-binding protein [soil metagenome]
MAEAAWELVGASYRYPRGPFAVRDVTLSLPAATLTAIAGPNGAGKSTLLALLLGHLTPTNGTASYGGRALREWTPRALAREVAVMPQHEHTAFSVSVRDLVAMGRYPHLGLFEGERDADRRAVNAALARCDLESFRDRPVDALSGGEQQRVRLARAMAQEPRAYVLDEPTAGLDVLHEMALFEFARELCAAGATVVLVTHQLNLAARYADRIALLSEGALAIAGTPRDVVTAERCSSVFRWPIDIHPHPGPGADAGAPQVVPIASSGVAGRGGPITTHT